jgi:hypothetical protein
MINTNFNSKDLTFDFYELITYYKAVVNKTNKNRIQIKI